MTVRVENQHVYPSGYHSDVPLETSTNGLHGLPGLLQCLRDTYNVVVFRKNMRIASRKVNAINHTHGNCSNSAMTYTGAPSISHLALQFRFSKPRRKLLYIGGKKYTVYREKMTVYLSHSPLRDLSPPRLPQNSIPLLELDGSHFCRGLFGSALKPHGLGGVTRPPPELLLPRN
jgi:hypothetical protein